MCTVFPSTDSINADIETARRADLSVVVEVDLSADGWVTTVIASITNNPAFSQLGVKEFLLDLVRVLGEDPQSEMGIFDYFYVQRMKKCVLLIVNTNEERAYRGVSAFIEINHLRANLFNRFDPKHLHATYQNPFSIGYILALLGTITAVAYLIGKQSK